MLETAKCQGNFYIARYSRAKAEMSFKWLSSLLVTRWRTHSIKETGRGEIFSKSIVYYNIALASMALSFVFFLFFFRWETIEIFCRKFISFKFETKKPGNEFRLQ
jgi:hypothetical protein